jgi:hypothetical protein
LRAVFFITKTTLEVVNIWWHFLMMSHNSSGSRESSTLS